MVLPTRGQQLARKVRNYQGDIYIRGIEMGGNPLSGALKEKLKEGYQVFITPEASKTIDYDLNKIKERGFTLISENEFETLNEKDCFTIYTADVLPDLLNDFFQKQDISPDFDFVAVAVQDHGKSIEGSSTNFRGLWIQKRIEVAPTLDSFLFSETKIPSYLLRMQSIVSYLKKFYSKSQLYVMDTVFAAIQGASYSQPNTKRLISMDIGNGHTAAAAISSEEIYGYFEFHTSAITPEKLEWSMEKLRRGNLSNEEIWREGGHGAFTRNRIFPPFSKLFVTGPHRQLITKTKLKYEFANPLGDTMITGCVGLALGIEKREGIEILSPF